MKICGPKKTSDFIAATLQNSIVPSRNEHSLQENDLKPSLKCRCPCERRVWPFALLGNWGDS